MYRVKEPQPYFQFWHNYAPFFISFGGRVVRRCHVSCVTGASNWYWLTVGQGLLSLKKVKVEGECFYFFCFFPFIPVPLSSLFLSFISSTISSISFLPFSGRRHKMTHKGWRVVKPQHNQIFISYIGVVSAPCLFHRLKDFLWIRLLQVVLSPGIVLP